MEQRSGKLGTREYISIAILMIGSKAAENTPSALYDQVQSAAWMIPILSGGIFIIPLYLLIKTLSLFQGKDLYTVSKQLLGKYMSFFMLLLIFIISSLAMSFDSRMYADIIRTFYFRSIPILLLYAIFMFVCAYGAKKGIQHIGSVAYLIIVYVLFAFILAIVLSSRDSHINAIFPIFGTGILDILKNSIPSTTLFADFFILTTIIPFLSTNEFRKGTWVAFIISIIMICASVFIFICLFDRSLEGLTYPFHTAIRYISIGHFLTNVETLFFPIWLLGAFIRFASILYIIARIFGQLFSIQETEFLIPALTVIFLLIGMIPETSMDVALQFKATIRFIAGPTFIVFSLFLWVIALVKGEFKHEKNKKSL